MNLSNLKPPKGQKQKNQRIGQGMGSGRGKYSGRGAKGQKSVSGYSAMRGFEGGQTPLHRRLPKRGFTNIFRKDYTVVNLGRLQQALDAGKLKAEDAVDAKGLVAAGILRRARDGVRLLAKGKLTVALTIEVAGASKSAIAAVEAAGGKVVLHGAAANAKSGADAAAAAPEA